MPFTAPSPIVRAKSYLAMVRESTWGTTPGSPTWIHVPCENYGIEFQPQNRKSKPFLGAFGHKHNRNIKGWPAGQNSFYLHGWRPTGLTESLAQWLLTWACANPETADRLSNSCFWAEGPNIGNQIDKGVRVNQFTLSGSEDQPIMLATDCIGRDQVGDDVAGSAPTLPNDRNRLVEYLFEHMTFELDGTEIPVGGFSWTGNFAMKVACYNDVRPHVVRAVDMASTLQLTRPREDDVWQEIVRSLDPEDEHELVIAMKGLHMGTGDVDTEWNQTTITFPLLALTTAPRQGGRDDLASMQLNFDVLKPDTSDARYSLEFEDVA